MGALEFIFVEDEGAGLEAEAENAGVEEDDPCSLARFLPAIGDDDAPF